MDEDSRRQATSRLMRQLKDKIMEASDDDLAEIIREARDEALHEARAIIREIMIQAFLEHALAELEGTGTMLERAEVEEQTARHPISPAYLEEQIQQEIEAIRGKIAENERRLSEMTPERRQRADDRPQTNEMGEARKAHHERERSEGSCGCYVYAIVMKGGGQLVAELPEQGIDPAYPVYALQPSAVSHRLSPGQTPSAISAIVSRVPLQEFGQEELKSNLNDIQWLEAKVRAHQRVLEAVSANQTLIPLRFCTIYRSESRVQDMLAQHYDDLVETLERLESKQEWGVKIYCDSKALARRLGEISDRVKELQAEMQRNSGGAVYFLRKKLENTIAVEVERLSDECAQRSHDRLSSRAEEAVINPLQRTELTGRKEAMLLNGAYLVAEEQLAAFRAELESLEEEYGHLGFCYEMTGPWAPYNFLSLSFEEDVPDE